jgi:uncharacterized SAM-binding protein YcdF (DUF218 family)
LSLRRRARRFLVVLALAVAGATFLLAGLIIDHTDPLAPADVIYVLGGSRISRALEAAELYGSAIAPRIIISQGAQEAAENQLAARGIRVPTEGDVARDILVSRLSVPPAAVEVLPDAPDNTAQEAAMILRRVRASHWTRLIVITDCASTRRAGFIFRRTLGPDVTVAARCARTDTYEPWLWWRSRATFRETFYELPKLVAYWCGLRG